MHVLMVDDHVMFLQGLRSLLGLMLPGLRVDTAHSIETAVVQVASANHDLVLLDWHLAEGDGDQAIERLREAGCLARIVVLSGETDAALIRRSVDCGAAGFVPKQYSSEQMISALEQVLAGQIFLPFETPPDAPPATRDPESDPRLAGLTPRQIDVYRAAARGLSNKLIARELGIAPSTVKSHLSAVFAALGVANRTEAAYQASREGLRLF